MLAQEVNIRQQAFSAKTCASARVPTFRISGTAGRIALKFSEWLETHLLGVLQESRYGMHLHVRTCTPLFRISVTDGWIALKFDMRLGNH